MARRGRDDPYKGFNFNILFGTVAAAVAGFAIVRKLMPKVSARYLDPNEYVRDIPATGRPIEGVGTTVAAGRKAPKSKGRGGAGRGVTASGTRRTRAAKPKRR